MQIEKYEPKALKPFAREMEKTTLLRRIRFFIDYLYGYSVYYLKEDGEYAGYCTITSGKNPRFWFAGKDDIIVGPYYTDEAFRGRGVATRLAGQVINHYETQWKRAYLLIKNDNTASIKVAKKLGAQFAFHVKNTKLKRLVKSKDGEYGIYKISR